MPWRNPATGLFESGNGPVDRRQSDGVGQPTNLPQEQTPAVQPRSGWDGSKGEGYAGTVTEILGVEHVGIKDQHSQTDQSIGPEPQAVNDAPDATGQDAPKMPGR